MDSRKIEFLIAVQHEINKLKVQEGESTRVERLKSRFYNVAPLADFAQRLLEGFGDKKLEFGTEEGVGKDESESVVTDKPSGSERKQVGLGFPHKPKDVADFMRLFDNANAFKYLTHGYDEVDKPFEIGFFLTEAKRIFDTNTKQYVLPKSLYAVILQFAFEPKPVWTAVHDKIVNEGWSKSELIAWSKQQNRHLCQEANFQKTIQSFRDSTRIKSNLQKIIEETIFLSMNSVKDKFDFEYKDLEKADFYTYVVALCRALGHLFSEMKEHTDCRKVSIYLERDNNDSNYRKKILNILHHDSFPQNKTLEEVVEKYRNTGGHLRGIRNNLFGYCDWHIDTLWEEKPLRLHLLKQGMRDHDIELETESLDRAIIKGFKNTFTFYSR